MNKEGHKEDPQKWGFRFDNRVAIRYHLRLADFYTKVHKITLLVTLIGSTAFFSDIIQDNFYWRLLFAGFVSTFAIVNIVFDITNRAEHHRYQARRYNRLLANLEKGIKLKQLQQEQLNIEEDELYRNLNNLYALCSNEVAFTHSKSGELDYEKQKHHLTFWQRWWVLPYMFNFGSLDQIK